MEFTEEVVEADVMENEAQLPRNYSGTVCRVFKHGVQNWKDFCLKIKILKGSC